jgi:hypothetical protein
MFPKVASLGNYGGALADYSAPSDSTTDRPAAGANPAFGDVAAMTHACPRLWARLTLKASGAAPVLVAHDEGWNNATPGNPAPTPARTSAGLCTLTYPTTILDEIPPTIFGASGPIGYSGPIALNLRAAWANDRGGAVWGACKAIITAPNVVTIYFWIFAGGAPSNTDPLVDTDVDIYAL